jgi:Uma2 family endonuclease
MAKMTSSVFYKTEHPISVSASGTASTVKKLADLIPTQKRVSEAEYWAHYHHHEEHQYEWNNGYLEVKPMTDHVSYLMYQWLVNLLANFLLAFPIGKMIGLEMSFRLSLPNQVTIRKPDLGVVLNSNPVPLGPFDQSYRGIFDLCLESLSYSTPAEVKRDTVTKKAEYEQAGVKEYYVLDARGKPTTFYQLNAAGIYTPILPTAEGIIISQVLPGWQFRLTDLQRKPSLVALSEDPVYSAFVLPALQLARLAQQAAEAKAQLAEARAQAEQEARHQETKARQLAEAKAQAEQEARQALAAKLQQLEAELARLRQT